MTVEEVNNELNMWKEDLALYKTYWEKARGEDQIRLEEKYQSLRKMIDKIQLMLNNTNTSITKGDFKC